MSNILTLSEAIPRIVQLARESQPFFFIIGAGVSAPTIKLSPGIITDCQDELTRRGDRMPVVSSDDPMRRYSAWMRAAFADPALRREYLERLVTRARLSSANMLLAHILLSRKIAKLVVTTNFDDHLHRALHLFGEVPVVLDHSALNVRYSATSSRIQIVHVHGTYMHYDCLNTALEIERRSGSSTSSDPRPDNLLSGILREGAPIVLGYSGWPHDVIMQAIEKRLSEHHPPPFIYYWFCYKESDQSQLPSWLRESEHVRFVVCDTPLLKYPGFAKTPREQDEGVAVRQFVVHGPSFGDVRLMEAELRASMVLRRMRDEAAVPLPNFATRPLEYVASVLEQAYGPAEDQHTGEDAYGIAAIIGHLRSAQLSMPDLGVEFAAKISDVHGRVLSGDVHGGLAAAMKLCEQPSVLTRPAILALVPLLEELQENIRLSAKERATIANTNLVLLAQLEQRGT